MMLDDWFLKGIRLAEERGLIVRVGDTLMAPKLARHLCTPGELGSEAA